MYLLAVTFSLCLAYFILYFLFPFFFERKFVRMSARSLSSIIMIFVGSILGYIVVFNIQDPELSNRILHGFGGGFMALFVCYRVVKDTKIRLSKFQFFIFALLIVAALGIANEILEFILQNYAGIIFAVTINDTWHDLISNTIGSFIGVLLFLPLIQKPTDTE